MLFNIPLEASLKIFWWPLAVYGVHGYIYGILNGLNGDVNLDESSC